MARMARLRRGTLADFATAYERQATPPTDDADTLVIPEDLTALSDADLNALADRARDSFTQLYEAGEADGYSQETLDQLSELTVAIEALDAETSARTEASTQRSAAAAALAARVTGPAAVETEEAEETGDDPDEGEEPDQAETEVEQPQALAASSQQNLPVQRGATRVNLAGLRGRQTAGRPGLATSSVRSGAFAAPDVPGFSAGQGMDLLGLGRAVDARLAGFNQQSFSAASQAGQHLRQQYPVASIHKSYPDAHRVQNDQADAAMDAASDESQLPGGSLVASGGWCAPSEVLYDLFDEGVTREGMLSAPEIGVSRGGIRWTRGPNYASLFANTGFAYTEANDIGGKYAVDGNGVGTNATGTKPCYTVTCDTFDEARLGLDGLCIRAGLLQRRGYPEMIAQAVQLALLAHDHRLNGRKIASLEAGSTAVSMPAAQVGAAAPLLTAIELEVEHMRHLRRNSRSRSYEAVFPYWVMGVIRSDLSRRLGVELLSVTDAQIRQWFTVRGINPQFVYDWQDIATTSIASFNKWPTAVKFLIYPAGTWVFGGSDVITLDTLYDSTLLGTNDFTALFTEEAWLVAKRGYDSRIVTVNVAPNGETGAGVLINADGSVYVAP